MDSCSSPLLNEIMLITGHLVNLLIAQKALFIHREKSSKCLIYGGCGLEYRAKKLPRSGFVQLHIVCSCEDLKNRPILYYR